MGGTGARVNLPPALASATYDANNRLTNWGGTTLTYDFNGNLTNDGSQTFTWDTRDRLTALTGGTAASFGYDAFNRRYTKTVGGTQTGTIYDGYSEVHNATGATINATYLNGLSLDERYARTQGGVTLSFLPDALGSTLNLVSPGGAMTGTFTYEPYGSSTQSGVDNTQYRYTGREEDGTGLMYYRNRYYNPRTSRFVSEDPIGLNGGYNLYAYVRGDPISFVDPDGLFTALQALSSDGAVAMNAAQVSGAGFVPGGVLAGSAVKLAETGASAAGGAWAWKTFAPGVSWWREQVIERLFEISIHGLPGPATTPPAPPPPQVSMPPSISRPPTIIRPPATGPGSPFLPPSSMRRFHPRYKDCYRP